MSGRVVAASGAALVFACSMLTGCGGGGGGGSAPPPAPADTTAPQTTLATVPTSPSGSTSATFTFTSNETATFEGRLDGGAFATVTSPHTLNNLAEGSHTFEVRARDAATNTDATPAAVTWVIDTTPPDTQITAAPSATTVVNTATFNVQSSESGGVFEVSLDGATFAQVTLPYTPSGLADGPHTIQFRARDAANNVDASAASASWTLDATPAQVSLVFPTPNFYTDAATVTVRGTAQDPNGVSSVTVNGVAAQSSDNFAHWSAVITVPVTAGTPITIASRDTPGNDGSAVAANMMNRGPFINTARSVAYDAQRNRVLVVDQATGNVVAFDRTTGIGQMLSAGPAPGTTPGSWFEEIVIDAANDRALILKQQVGADEIVAINLVTGARSVVSPSGGSSSPTRLEGSFSLTLDGANQRVYVSAGIVAAIVRIDLATGARSIVSSDSVGSGESLVNPYGIAFDAVTNPAAPRLLVVAGSVSGAKIVSIDLANGNRTTLSSASVGTGVDFVYPVSLRMDAPRGRVLVGDVNDASMLAVDLATGNRTTLSSFNVGTGPNLSWGSGLDFDPVSGIAFGLTSGGFGELDTATQVRRIVGHADVGLGDRPPGPSALFIEQASGTPSSLIYMQQYGGAIYRMQLDTGNRSIFSWHTAGIGSGPSLQGALDMVPDRRASAGGRAALVLVGGSAPKLVSVDLITGNRTLITDLNVGLADNSPQRLTLDVTNNRVLFGNNEAPVGTADEIYAVNLANGAVSMISGPSNTGPMLVVPGHMVVEPAANPTRVLVGDAFSAQIIAVDLASGNRSTFDSGSSGSGITYTRVGPLLVDAARGRLLAHHIDYPSHLFSRALSGGTRELISGANPLQLAVRGSGPPYFYVQAMDVDFAADVGYISSTNNGAIMAVDLVSGDRVIIAH
jgi:hypothetical protein